MQKIKQLKKELEYAQYEDPDSAILLEVKIAKIEKAKQMRKHGVDNETIRADVWSRPNEWCQGTCGGFNTWESHNAGSDTCWDCKLEAMN